MSTASSSCRVLFDLQCAEVISSPLRHQSICMVIALGQNQMKRQWYCKLTASRKEEKLLALLHAVSHVFQVRCKQAFRLIRVKIQL